MGETKQHCIWRERIWIFIFSVLVRSCGIIEGAVTISPTGIAGVCSGGHLELMCTTTGSFLRWRFSVTRGVNDIIVIRRTIQAAVPASDAIFEPLVVNSTMFNFSRISAEGSLPVKSKVIIGPISSSLNGTVINCIDLNTQSSTATTIVTGEGEPLQELNVRERLVEFEINGVTIILKWNELNPLYSVNVNVVPETHVNISGSTAQLTVTYNVMYNVSIMISHLCGQNNVTVLSEEYYYPSITTSNAIPMKFCGNPEELIDDSVTVSGYTFPAVEGTTVTFHCPPGAVLHGINSSICMENGEWEPALKDVKCSSIMVHSNADSQDNNIEVIVGCSLAVTLGLAIIVTVATIIGFLIKARFKGSTTVSYKRTTQQEGIDAGIELSPVPIENNHSTKVANVQTGGLVYADIGQATFNHQRQLLPGIPDLDDSPLEYASINHNAHVEPSASQNTVTNIDIPSVNLDSLLIQLRSQITAKWYQFGEAAGIEKAVLDSFVKSCSPDDCIIEMLDYWLRKNPKKLTWWDIAGVLRAINYLQMANDIERVYVTGKLPVEVDMDWVPQTTEPETELPPPIPPKMNEIASFDASQDDTKMGPSQSRMFKLTEQGNDSAPVLPPKPKCAQMMIEDVPPRPPRF